MHRTSVPPRPHFLCDKWKIRSEQTKYDGQCRLHRTIRRLCPSLTMVTVAARLHQLQIVVAEAPEECFGAIQDAGVFVFFEPRRRLVHDRCKFRQHSAIERMCDLTDRRTTSKRKLRRVE